VHFCILGAVNPLLPQLVLSCHRLRSRSLFAIISGSAALWCFPVQLAAQPAGGLFSGRASFNHTNHLVSVSVFHWFTATGGQLSGPWQPVEGRANWTGDTNFWQSQLKEIMAANIDMLYVHLIPSSEQQRINLFQALNQLRSLGWNVPKVAPFLDPMITWNQQPLVDVATPAGKDTFVAQYIRFFNQYYSVNQDTNADEYLARIDGRVVLDTWHVKFNLTNLNSLTRADVESRLQAAFAANHPVFTNGIRMITTALNDPTLSFADEKVPQFEITDYYYPVQWLQTWSAQLKGGYWDQNIRNPGSFLARSGGLFYSNAWNRMIAGRGIMHRAYLESWNEYDEGSGMYAANPGPPYIAPGSGNTNTDVWSAANDPYEYIKTTARGASAFNDWPDHDAAIVWHNIPARMQPGETRTATVIVRNEGDALWSEAAKFRFSQSDFDAVNFGHGRYLIDDSKDDIPTFGGIFRGRVKVFQLTLTAPVQPGNYLTHWGMLQENVEWFGQQITQNIYIEPLSAAITASPTNGAAPLAVQFTSQASGGRSTVPPVETTDDHLGTVTAAGENAGLNGFWEVATNAFDDSFATKWLDFANNYPATRQSWIQYQYPNGRRYLVTRYTITSANDAVSYPARNPAVWRLLGSNNGGASWVTLDLQTNQVFTGNFQKRTYDFTNTAAYNIYRFEIDRVANPPAAVAMQLDELEFFSVPAPYTYFWSFGDSITSTNQNPQHTYTVNGNYTATLVVSDGLTNATNSVTVSLAPPTLSASLTPDGRLSLSWPAWATGYSLYCTANLASPGAWAPVTNAADIVGSQFVLVLPIGSVDQFFKLDPAVNVVANVVVGQVRVQLLSDSLGRLELSGGAGFEDRSTFHVASRDFPGTPFTRSTVGGDVVLTTPNYVVHVPQGAASLAGVHVDSPAGQVLYSYTGLLTNSAWLGGPADYPAVFWFADAPRIVPSPWGVTPAPMGADFAETSGWDLSNDAPDVYVFVPHGDYRRLRADFLKLTGPTDMVPLFALGAFDSRWYDYSETTALQQIDNYRAHRIPLDALVNDTGWRVQEYVYQPNPSLFPNLPRYFQEAHARGVHIQFNDHPQALNSALSALDPYEVQYRCTNLAAILNQGLDIWWYDRNWGPPALPTPIPNLRKEVWGMRTYHDATLAAKPGLRPLIMANVDGIDNGIRNTPPDAAAHRFPFQWTGDVEPDFSFLQGALENCVYSGVQALLPYMSTDLGGFVADPTVEGYIRWVQFGALSPIYRPHCTMTLTRMPWTFGPTAETIARRFLNLRYRLLPAFYAAARDNYESGEPLVRRLDLDYPQYPQARGNDEFLIGKGILVAPIIRGSPVGVLSDVWLTTPSGQRGLQGDYFNNNALVGPPVLTRTDPVINFDWGTGSPAPNVPADYFSARWTGTIQVPANIGDIVLVTVEDDGVRLWLDGQLVIDAWGPHNSSTSEASTPVTAGVPHSIRIEYQEITGNAVIKLEWHRAALQISQDVWIPPGTWVDAWTGQPSQGPRYIINNCPLDRMPIYIRSGALVAQAPEMQFTAQMPWDPITLDVYPTAGETNQVTLYEDDTFTRAYQQGQYRKTAVSAWNDNLVNRVSLAIDPAAGTYSNAPGSRAWVARLHRPVGWPADLAPAQIMLNGQFAAPALRLIHNETAMPLGAKNGAPDADCFEVALPARPVTAGNYLEVSFASAPSPWTSRDISNVGFEGGAVCSNNLYLVRGGGADISGTSDSFHFMYLPLSGDAQVTARILSQVPTDPAAKAGVMLRETLDPASRHASIFITPGTGLSLQWRPATGAIGSGNGTLPGAAPYWVRLVRSGTNVTGYISGDGAIWTPAGGIGLDGLAQLAYWGLAVTARNNSTSSVAVIDNVTLHSPVAISPVPDQSTIAGLPLPAIPFTVGSATVPAESLSVTAASTNTTLLPVDRIAFSGAGSNRWAILAPAAGVTGASQVSLTAADGVYEATTAFLFTVNPVPQLTISLPAASSQVDLSWPDYAAGMALLSATNLTPPVLWFPPMDGLLATNAGAITATVPATNTRFFRLSLP
jgi:PKD repeat protein